jgi:hypothetical protein
LEECRVHLLERRLLVTTQRATFLINYFASQVLTISLSIQAKIGFRATAGWRRSFFYFWVKSQFGFSSSLDV